MTVDPAEASVLTEMDAEARRRRIGAIASAALLVVFSFALVTRAPQTPTRSDLVFPVFFLGLAVIAIAWRKRGSLVQTTMLTAAAALVAVQQARAPGWNAEVGAHCMLLELIAAVLPAAVTLGVMWRNGDPIATRAVAVTAWWGGLCGQFVVSLICSARFEREHLLVFHVGGALVSAALVAAVAWGLRRQQL